MDSMLTDATMAVALRTLLDTTKATSPKSVAHRPTILMCARVAMVY